ncbi:hypothetical protein, partial [Bradyrhizobium sp.]|uniref:hypothetical protein n=1 Tax=Bradyrhizobium sp. TaxID=376 RepID=UPI00261B071C
MSTQISLKNALRSGHSASFDQSGKLGVPRGSVSIEKHATCANPDGATWADGAEIILLARA